MTHPIPCQDAVRQLWRYLDDTIDHDERQRIDAHLAFCLRCCGELEFARELQHLLRTRAATSAPSSAPALERLRGFLDELPSHPATEDDED